MAETPNELDVEIESDRPSFVMVPNWLVDANPSPVALATYVRLRRRADWSSGRVAFSLAQLAQELGYSRRQTLHPYLDELVALGALEIQQRHGENGAQLRNVYRVLLTPVRPTVPPVRSSAQPPCAPAHAPRTLQRTARKTDPLSPDVSKTDTSAQSTDGALDVEIDTQSSRADVDELCARLREKLLENGVRPQAATVTKGWRDAARLLLDRDGVPLAAARAVLEFATDDPFWRKNVLSMPTFRRQFDRLRLAMPTDGPGTAPTTEQRQARPLRQWDDTAKRDATARAFLERGLEPELWDDVARRGELREALGQLPVVHDGQTLRVLHAAWIDRGPIDLEVPGWRRALSAD